MQDIILSIIKSNMSDYDKLAAVAAIAGLKKARKDLYWARVQNGANKRKAEWLEAELNK